MKSKKEILVDKDVIEMYNTLKSILKTAKYFKVSEYRIRKILNINNIRFSNHRKNREIFCINCGIKHVRDNSEFCSDYCEKSNKNK